MKKIFTIKDVEKTYKTGNGGSVHALSKVNLDIYENEFICVVGPSGCGKSTLLNILAGLEKNDSGEVLFNNNKIVGPGPDRAIIFQQYALYPWLTVRKNILFPLRYIYKKELVDKFNPETGKTEKVESYRKYTKQEKIDMSQKYIDLVNLTGFEDSYPSALSGGMKQRVAIARAYMTKANVLLMDEPFGAVDAQTRSQLQEDLLKSWETEKKTCFFITHDVEEAALLSTRVVVMSSRPGRVKDIIDVDLPYPRTQATKLTDEFVAIKNRIWSQVYQEYLEIKK